MRSSAVLSLRDRTQGVGSVSLDWRHWFPPKTHSYIFCWRAPAGVRVGSDRRALGFAAAPERAAAGLRFAVGQAASIVHVRVAQAL